jgi:hypothetical protein
MMVGYDGGVIDHTILLKKGISDDVVYLVGKAQSDNIFADDFENPTEEDYEILGKVACDMLAREVWAVDELAHVCEDCVGKYAADICKRFRRKHKLNRKYDPVRIGVIVHTAAELVAICSRDTQYEFYEAIARKAEEIERKTGTTEGIVSVCIGGEGVDQHD